MEAKKLSVAERIVVAQAATNERKLATLAKDPSWKVRLEVVMNSITSVNTLKFLEFDRDDRVRRLAELLVGDN